MLRTRNALNAAVDYRLSVFRLQEVHEFDIPFTLRSRIFSDLSPTGRTSFHVLSDILILFFRSQVLGHFLHFLVVAIDYLHQARPTERAAAIIQDKRGPEVQRLHALFFPLLVDGD